MQKKLRNFLIIQTIALTSLLPDVLAGVAPRDSMLLCNVTFWRHELRLNREQVWHIQTINRNVYEAIDHLADQQLSRRENLNNLLHTWRTTIYDVLTPRQKRKLGRLYEYYYPKTSR